MTTIRLDGTDLEDFYEGIADANVPDGVRVLQIRVTPDGVQVSVNEGTWSPAMGVAE